MTCLSLQHDITKKKNWQNVKVRKTMINQIKTFSVTAKLSFFLTPAHLNLNF
jgi:hypothetical protein